MTADEFREKRFAPMVDIVGNVEANNDLDNVITTVVEAEREEIIEAICINLVEADLDKGIHDQRFRVDGVIKLIRERK